MSITGSAKPGLHEHVAEVVHVDEAADVRVAVDAARTRARSSFSVSGPKVVNVRRPPTAQHAPELGERARQVVDPLQREVGPHEVDARRAERQRVDVAADERRRARHARERPSSRESSERLAPARARRVDHRARRVERDEARVRDSAPRARRAPRPVPQPASSTAAGASLTTSRRAASRAAHLALQHRRARRSSPPRGRTRAAPRAGRARADRAGGAGSVAIDERLERARRTPRGATGTARAPRLRCITRLRVRQRAARATRPRRAARARRASPLTTSVGRVDPADVGAQVGGGEDAKRVARARRATARRARSSWSRSAASVARPSSLPRTCSARKRCSVSAHDAANSSPKRASVVALIACGQPSPATKRGVVAAPARAARCAPASRSAQRIAHGPPSDQPSTVSGSRSSANARGDRVDERVERRWARRRGERPWPGRSTACTRKRARERRQQRREQARVQCPSRAAARAARPRRPIRRAAAAPRRGAPRSRRRRAHRSSRAATSRPRSSRSTSPSVCAADSDTRSRAVPRGHRRRPDRRHEDAAPLERRGERDRRVRVADDQRLDRRARRREPPRQRRRAGAEARDRCARAVARRASPSRTSARLARSVSASSGGAAVV